MRYHISKVIFIGCCIFQSIVIYSQTTYNSIYKIENNPTIFTESSWYRDTLIVVGSVLSDSKGAKAPILKFLKDGSLFSTSYLNYSGPDFGISFWSRGLTLNKDTIQHTALILLNDAQHSLIVNANLNGDIFNFKEITGVLAPVDDFCQVRAMASMDNGYLLLDYIVISENISRPCLLRLDNNFSEIWRRCYSNQNSLILPYDVISCSDEGQIILTSKNNLDVAEKYVGPGNGYYNSYIFKSNIEGDINFEWLSDSNFEIATAGTLDNDSILVVAAAFGEESCNGNQSNDICWSEWSGGAFKLNLNTGKKIWSQSMAAGEKSTLFDSRYSDIIHSIEGDGYILCGSGFFKVEPDCQLDIEVKCWSYPGVIAKVSNTGDSLWLRKYFGVQDIYESNVLRDVEITPDSGYSFVGEAFNPWPGESQGQHGWVMKTDAHGCLVPGCHLISNTDLIQPIRLNELIKIYPNPVNDIANILIQKDLPQNTIMHLVSSHGKKIKTFKHFEVGATYSIPVDDLPSGIYIILLTSNSEKIGYYKLIKL